MAGRFQETKGRWEIVPSSTINADKVIVPIDDSSSQNLETFLASIREYIDAQIKRVASGCTVTLEGNGVTIRPSNVAYLKPALIEVEEDDGYLLSDISITMGGSDITSAAWDSTNYVITIPKVTNDINISVTTTIMQLGPILDLDGVTLEYNAIRYLQEWTAEIVPDTGNKVQSSSVSILMGGEDITSTVYNHSTGTIVIPSVTGRIDISAVGRPYDTEVEYLESTGNEWIDTGILPTVTTTIEANAMVTAYKKFGSNTYSQMFGARYSDSSVSGGFVFAPKGSSSTTYWSARVGSTSTNSGKTIPLNTKAHIEMSFSSAVVTPEGAALQSVSYTPTWDANYATLSLYIFSVNTPSSDARQFVGRIYDFKIYDNDVLVRDYIPVKNNDTGYLYDKVSGQLFGNINSSGAFICGPDKS